MHACTWIHTFTHSHMHPCTPSHPLPHTYIHIPTRTALASRGVRGLPRRPHPVQRDNHHRGPHQVHRGPHCLHCRSVAMTTSLVATAAITAFSFLPVSLPPYSLSLSSFPPSFSPSFPLLPLPLSLTLLLPSFLSSLFLFFPLQRNVPSFSLT